MSMVDTIDEVVVCMHLQEVENLGRFFYVDDMIRYWIVTSMCLCVCVCVCVCVCDEQIKSLAGRLVLS
jgi:hypothetical protein